MLKRTFLLALCLAFCQVPVNTAFAAGGKVQPTTSAKSGIAPLVKFDKDPEVNINLSNAAVSDVLKSLTEQVGMNLVITNKLGDENIPRIEFNKMKLSEAFTILLKIKNLSVKKINNTLFIGDSKAMNDIGFSDSVIKSYKITNMKTSEAAGQIASFYIAPNMPPKMITSDPTNTLTIVSKPLDIEYFDMVVKSVDIPIPQVMIEIKLIEITESASRNLNFSYGFGQKQLSAGFNNATTSVGGNAAGNVKSSSTSLTFDALRDLTANFNAQIDALLNKSQAKILTNPRIATQNGKEATFNAGDQSPVIKTERTAVGSTQSVEFLPLGDKITVTPTLVDPESGFVTLDISPSISNKGRELIINGNPVPEKSTRELKTTMKTRSGEAVILAGLKRKGSTTGSSKIPILGDIPFLGALFGSNNWNDNEVELIIMVTPYILDEGGKGGNTASSSLISGK
ncbi:MAG: hypothetical protein AABZ74_09230 [Cyanobacteriota bacterium]